MWHLFLLVLVCLGEVLTDGGPRIPPNPCPSVFNYYQQNDDSIFGEILVPNDGTKIFRMEVNTSYAGLFDERSRPRLRLELMTPKDYLLRAQQLTYRLTFTRQDIIPRITQIKFNGRVYCNGPSESLTSEGVSELWVFKETRLQSFGYRPDSNYPEVNTHRPIPAFIPPSPRPTPGYGLWNNESAAGDIRVGSAAMIDLSQNDPQCGISDSTMNLIAGESSTVINEFPWLVALFKWHALNYEFTCTATLIDNKHVVTAAHCLRFYNSYLVYPEDILLVIGRSRLKHWAEKSTSVLRTVVKVDVHPDYTQYAGHGDIAVLTLSQPVEFSRNIKPLCLWNGQDDLNLLVGKYGIVAGWGKDDKQLEYLYDSKKADMPIVSQETCMRSNNEFQKLISEKTFCAGHRNGRGPCSSDSGSPLMIEKDGRWYLRGLLSQTVPSRNSAECSTRDFIVFADAGKYARWIRSKFY